VTERHVKLITPRNKLPFGLPEIVEEKYWDFTSGEYLLLKKTVNTHSDQGKLLQEDHYDSNENFAYSLKWEYDLLGNVTKKIDALGQTTIFRYDQNGNKTWEEGPRPGWHKEFTYDLADRLIVEKEVWGKESHITSHRYNAVNQRVATIDIYGNETTFEYNGLGRLVKTQGPALYTSPDHLDTPFEETQYDAMGNAILQRDANGHTTKYAYTIRGKPYLIEYPDGSSEQKEYSLDGLLVKEIARNGLTTIYTHDALGRVTSKLILDAQGEVKKTSATYSSFQLISETDENGTITTYEYDGAGRRISKKKGDHFTQYQYDALSRIVKTIDCLDADARITCKVYDLLDRVIEESIL